VCFVIVTSLRIVTDGNKETTYLLNYLLICIARLRVNWHF